MQKSPKLGNTGIKNLKIGVAPGSHAQPMQYNSVNTQSLGQKNVRLMLAGNSGNKSSQQTYKQMNEIKGGLNFSPTATATGGLSMIQPGSIPKTTKHGNQKYYSQGQS